MRLERRETASRTAMLVAPLVAVAVTLAACALLVLLSVFPSLSTLLIK